MVISSSSCFQLGPWFLSSQAQSFCVWLSWTAAKKGFALAEITFHLSLFGDAAKQPLALRLSPLLDPWAAGVALHRNFWADSLWLFAFFLPSTLLLLVSLHHHLPARGYFYLCIYFFPLKLQCLEVATGRTQSHMLCLTYINSVLGDSLSWPICSCQGIHYFSGPWGEKVLEHHYS